MYTHILHATDLSEDHYHMCQRAVEIAKHFQAQLFLLHVIETPPSVQLAQGLGFTTIDSPTPLKDDAQSVLSVLGEDLGIPKEQQLVEIGSIYQHTQAALSKHRCGLLIVGRHYHHHLFKHETHDENISCDVLTLA